MTDMSNYTKIYQNFAEDDPVREKLKTLVTDYEIEPDALDLIIEAVQSQNDLLRDYEDRITDLEMEIDDLEDEIADDASYIEDLEEEAGI